MGEGRYEKPLPKVNNWNRRFWEECNADRFTIQKCTDCGDVWHPPAPCCPRCLSTAWSWMPVSGRGTIWSFVVFHHCYYPSFSEDIPYNVCIVELEEGVRTITNVVGVENSELKIGMPVEVQFVRATDEFNIPVFRLAG